MDNNTIPDEPRPDQVESHDDAEQQRRQQLVTGLIGRMDRELAPVYDEYLGGAIPILQDSVFFLDGADGEQMPVLDTELAVTDTSWPRIAARLAHTFPLDGHSERYGIDGQPRISTAPGHGSNAYLRVAIPFAENAVVRLLLWAKGGDAEDTLAGYYRELVPDDRHAAVRTHLGYLQRSWRGNEQPKLHHP